nr:hypothetical protein [Tanacetum cinerariifolium]
MGDEHIDTISAMKSDEFLKSNVENLVLILCESECIPDYMCDVPFHDNSLPLNVSKDQFEDFSDSNDDSTSIDDDSFSIDKIEYVEASPPDSELVSLEVMEIVISEVGGIDADILLTIKDDILCEKLLNINLLIANIEALKYNPTLSSDFMTKSSSTSLNFLLEETNTFDNSLPKSKTFCFDLKEISSGSITTRFDISLPDYEAFYDDHVKEISSGSTTTHSDYSHYDSSDFYHEEFADEIAHIISPPEYDCFYFKNEPNSRDFTMDVVEDIFSTREPRVLVHNVLPTHLTLQLNLDFILSSESLFAYVVWIFLPFLSYSVAPQYILSFRNEDTIFDPGLSSYHIYSLMPDVSHQSGTYFNHTRLTNYGARRLSKNRDEHLDTILETKSDELIKSSVENLVPNPSASEDECEYDVPICDDFTTFSNLFFDIDDDFSSSDNESFSDEDISKEIYLNPLFDEEIISIKIDPHHFNDESDLIESLLNQDSSIISSSSKIDSLLDDFTGELILLKSIPPGIDEADCDLEEEIRLIKKLLYDNSSPHIDSLKDEINLSLTPDDSMPPGIKEDGYDSKRDMLILKELLSNDSLSLLENKSFHFDIPSSPRPLAKPPDDDEIEQNSGILTIKMVGDISEHYVPLPRLFPTQPTYVSNQEKYPHLLSHRGLKAFQLSSKSPMMIYGENIPILDVPFLHFYHP